MAFSRPKPWRKTARRSTTSNAPCASAPKQPTHRFKAVKLTDEELFKIPFIIMTGESDFNLTRKEIQLDHETFRTIFTIKDMKPAKSSGESLLRGLTREGKLVIVHSPDGLNDTSHTEGCCCCGGNEIQNPRKISANILAYALLH